MANPIFTEGLETTVALADDSWAIKGVAVDLCGHSNFEPTYGSADEKTIDTYCDGKEVVYGSDNPGTFTVTFEKYDPKDEGQALINSAPKNSKMLYTVTFGNGDKVTYKLIKKNKIREQPAKANIVVQGTVEMGLIGEGDWVLALVP